MNLYAYYLMAYGVVQSNTDPPNVPGLRPPLYAMSMKDEMVLAVTMGVADAHRGNHLKTREIFYQDFKSLWGSPEDSPLTVEIEGDETFLVLNRKGDRYQVRVIFDKGKGEGLYDVHEYHVQNLVRVMKDVS